MLLRNHHLLNLSDLEPFIKKKSTITSYVVVCDGDIWAEIFNIHPLGICAGRCVENIDKARENEQNTSIVIATDTLTFRAGLSLLEGIWRELGWGFKRKKTR